MDFEKVARAAGWFPTREAHIMFRNGDPAGVCRHFKNGEAYDAENDSLMSVPLKHARNWEKACKRDKLKA